MWICYELYRKLCIEGQIALVLPGGLKWQLEILVLIQRSKEFSESDCEGFTSRPLSLGQMSLLEGVFLCRPPTQAFTDAFIE